MALEDNARSAKIINGSAQDPFLSPQILKIDILNLDGSSSFCTGTVIGNNSLLTAGHCFAGGVRAAFVTKPDGSVSQLTEAYVHPSYGVNNELKAIFYDVAVVKTASPLALPVLGILTSVEIAAPAQIGIYGFGLDENGDFGSLHSGTMEVNTVTPNHLISVFNDFSNTCNGDSGGPAVYTVLDAAGNILSVSIAGVTSSGSNDDCSKGDVSLFTNLNNPAIISFISGLVPEIALQ